MYNALTIQTYVNGQWHDALDLSFSDPQQVAGARCTTSYRMEYLHAFYDVTENIFEYAVSVNLPVNWGSDDIKGFPAFVYDIIPAGHARKSLLKRFNDEKPEGMDIRDVVKERRAPPDLLVDMPLDIRQSNALPVNDLDRYLGYWELQ